MASLRIHPLHLGTITREKSTFGYRLDPGKVVDAPLVGWYIEGAEKNILIDTGGGDPSDVPAKAPYTREKDQFIDKALRKIGVNIEDVEVVITTHLHWDHCGGNGLFPNAEIFLQKEELRSAHSPFPIYAKGYIRSMIDDINYTIVSGDQKIAEGVSVILTPGHTYGMQGILVEAETQRYFIAGDTIELFECLDKEPPLISGVYVDLKKYYASLKRIARLSATILPGHDFRIFEKGVYF